MKALFVGQKVRVVGVTNPRLMQFEGVETWIVSRAPDSAAYDLSHWIVALRDPLWHVPIGAHEDNLEPILIDGIESETTEETTQPEQVTA